MLQPIELHIFIQQLSHCHIVVFLRREDCLLRRLEYAETSLIFNLCDAQLRLLIRIKPFRERLFIIWAAIADLIFLTFFPWYQTLTPLIELERLPPSHARKSESTVSIRTASIAQLTDKMQCGAKTSFSVKDIYF